MPDIIYDPSKKYYMHYFVYSTKLTRLPTVAGQTAETSILISDDAPFAVNYITATVLQANVVVINWGGLIQIEDSSPNRKLFNTPITLDALRGNGQLPYQMQPPKMLNSNSTLQIVFTQNVVTVTDIQIHFHGHKLTPQ
jgi:hypothetical protein